MTIKTIKVCDYVTMADYLDPSPSSIFSSKRNSISALASRHDKVWIISITNPGKTTDDKIALLLVTQDTDDKIALQFDDDDPDKHTFGYMGIPEAYSPTTVLFDDLMADKVCKFISKAHNSSIDSYDLLVINCQAGISRSGAVGWFARQVCGLDFDAFKKMNPQINPNSYVLNLLLKVWEKNNVAF